MKHIIVAIPKTNGNYRLMSIPAKTKREFEYKLEGVALALEIDNSDIEINSISLQDKWFQ